MPVVLPNGRNYFATSTGAPLVGGRLYAFIPGTSTPKDTYTTSAGTTPNTHPVVMDARGEAAIYWDGAYDVVLRDSADVLIWGPERLEDAGDTLRTDLASNASASVGSGLVGHDHTLNYAAGTVGYALGGVIVAKVTGVAGDAAILQAAFTAANGTGKTVRINGAECLVNTSLSLVNHAHYDIDWCGCNVEYTGGAGTYMMDMTQAGRINQRGGVFTGSGANHFVKTAGSAAAQATTYPTIPTESLWSRQLRFAPSVITGFATAFDLQNFTREVWIAGYITGNVTGIKVTGKVVNVYGNQGLVLYSGVASSNALYVRGDAGDATYRYAEGLFFQGAILDTVGTAADVRDVYLLDLNGAQLKTSAGGYALDLTKGICPLTRDIFLSRALMQGKLRIGSGLSTTFLFGFHASDLAFSDVADTAIVIDNYCQSVHINSASFNGGTGTPKMFSVGTNCVAIRLYGLSFNSSEYTTLPTIDSTSVGGVEAEFTGSFTPGIAFGGSSTGITYSTQSGRYYYRGGFITGFFKITLTNKGAQTGAATITGLPFAARLLNGTATVGLFSSMNTALTPVLDITEGTSVINIRTGASGSASTYADTAFSNSSIINGSFMYPAA